MIEYKTTNIALTAMADKIREKNNTNNLLTWSENTGFATDIENISSGINTSNANATANDILNGKTAYVNNNKITGNILTKTNNDITISNTTMTMPIGYYNNTTKTLTTTTHPNPTASMNTSTGLVTASHTQNTGYITSGTTTSTI